MEHCSPTQPQLIECDITNLNIALSIIIYVVCHLASFYSDAHPLLKLKGRRLRYMMRYVENKSSNEFWCTTSQP